MDDEHECQMPWDQSFAAASGEFTCPECGQQWVRPDPGGEWRQR